MEALDAHLGAVDRVAHIDEIANASIAESNRAAGLLRSLDKPDVAPWREQRRRAVFTKYLTIYRTLADPAYLDLSIDPDERPMGSLFAFPDPLDANYGRGGLARTMTADWLVKRFPRCRGLRVSVPAGCSQGW